MQVNFEVDNKLFKDFSFHPIGIEGYSIKDVGILNKNFDEMFIISPFFSESVIKQFNGLAKSSSNVLITRKSELSKLKIDSAPKFETYDLKDIVIDGDSEDKALDNKQDIHSKIYLIENGSKSELLLGSLNASYSAFYGNIEFVLRLVASKKSLDIAKIKKEIFGDNERENPFERVEFADFTEDEDSSKSNLERAIKDICKLNIRGKVKALRDRYSVEIEFEEDFYFENISVTISPLLKSIEKGISKHIVFDNLELLDISEFYIIKASDGANELRRIIKIYLEGLPENREKEIANNIIKDKNGFSQYLNFLLGEDYLLSAVENENALSRGFSNSNSIALNGLYEKYRRGSFK